MDLVTLAVAKGYTDKAIGDVAKTLGVIFKFKGVKATEAELPKSGNSEGDVWHVIAGGREFAWLAINGTQKWEDLGPILDGVAKIDDTTIATTSTWSSDKVHKEIGTNGELKIVDELPVVDVEKENHDIYMTGGGDFARLFVPKKYSQGLEITDQGTVNGVGICTDECIYIPETYTTSKGEVKKVTSINFRNQPLREIVTSHNITNLTVSECPNLKKAYLSEGIKNLSRLSYCPQLAEVILPRSLESTQSNAFWGANNLQAVYVPDLRALLKMQWNEVDGGAPFEHSDALNKEFYINNKLLEELIVPDDITILGQKLLYNVSSLKKVICGLKLKEISNNAFKECKNLNTIVFNNQLEKIGNSAFENCKGLSVLELPQGLKFIGERAFYEVPSTEFTVPSSVVHLGSFPGSYDVRLQKLNILNKIENMDYCTTYWYYLDRLPLLEEKGIKYRKINDNPYYFASIESKGFSISDLNPNVQVLKFDYGPESATSTLVIPDHVKIITDFTTIRNLVEVDIGRGVLYIGEQFLQGAKNLKIIRLHPQLKKIGNSSLLNSPFESIYYDSLSDWCRIKFNNDLFDINGGLGKLYCNNLPVEGEVSIPSDISAISDKAFYHYKYITSLICQKGLKEIGRYAFYICPNLVSVTLNDDLEVIGVCAFEYNKALTSVSFGSSLKTIKTWSFCGCTAMQYYDFTKCIQIPQIESNSFLSIPETCEIRVPLADVEKWKTATNWSRYANNIVGV